MPLPANLRRARHARLNDGAACDVKTCTREAWISLPLYPDGVPASSAIPSHVVLCTAHYREVLPRLTESRCAILSQFVHEKNAGGAA